MNVTRPKLLKHGDTIGIVSLSSPVAAKVPNRLRRAVNNAEMLGFNILLGDHVLACHGHTAGTIDQRIDDLHNMYKNPNIKAIISSIGGYNSNQLLDEIDYDLIRENPKIFMGYSDITAILLAIYKKTNQVTFLGPALLPQFGEIDGLHPYTREAIKDTLMSSNPIGKIPFSFECITELLEWDIKDDRPRTRILHLGPRVVRRGDGKGIVIAGNLGTFLSLCGTDFFPELYGAILLIEEAENKNLEIIDRLLTQFRLMNVYEKINGLIFGRLPFSIIQPGDKALDEILLRVTRDYTFPIVVDFDFGHTDPMYIFPIGIKTELYAYEEINFIFIENCVVE